MEEASKLESAESFSLKKTRDKNSLLDTEMTDWMLNSVQKAQIGMYVWVFLAATRCLCNVRVVALYTACYVAPGTVGILLAGGSYNTVLAHYSALERYENVLLLLLSSVTDGCSSRNCHSIYTLGAQSSGYCLANHFRLVRTGKTSSGTAMLTTGGLSTHPKLPPTSIVTEFNDSIKRTLASPTKMLPFDQFHSMFDEYTK
jgi:hypothetical protein